MSYATEAVKVIRAILGGAAVAAVMSAPAHAGQAGPPPINPSINVEKFINDVDADTAATALNVSVGDALTYKFRVTNDGDDLIFLTNITDSVIDLSPCNFQPFLIVGATNECIYPGFLAEAGQHFDMFSVDGVSAFDAIQVSDTDFAFYNAPVPNAVPEPATLALLGLGLAGLGFSRRRKLN